MPFDGNTKTEVDILNEMAATLATPDKWCQGAWKIGERHCLGAALLFADGSPPFGNLELKTSAARAVLHAMVEQMITMPRALSPWNEVCLFNNTHSHGQVLDLIARTRRVFEEETVYAV